MTQRTSNTIPTSTNGFNALILGLLINKYNGNIVLPRSFVSKGMEKKIC